MSSKEKKQGRPVKNPIHDEQLKLQKAEELGAEVLGISRNELYLNMRFMDVALARFRFIPWNQGKGLGTDGAAIYFAPMTLLRMYKSSRTAVCRAYLHMTFHCLFAHVFDTGGREEALWDIACDIAVEYLMDSLYLHCTYRHASPLRKKVYRAVKENMKAASAQGIYRMLKGQEQEWNLGALYAEFYVDDHSIWREEGSKQGLPQRKQQWDETREQMQTEMETFAKDSAEDAPELYEQIRAGNRERYDYRDFLRKFAVLREEMKVDMDSFDYIFYNYGLSVYGNMPLIEPQETKESVKIEEFVIVIDTSMSCKGELVKNFLEQTYAILSGSESFFTKIHIHIIQCDDKVRQDKVITSMEELKIYMEDFTVAGLGGTDFRPPFAYVEELLARGVFKRLKGLIYFTDGYGIFPVKMPPYETAFVFMEEDYRDIDVPPWAIKLIVEPEEFERSGTTGKPGVKS